MTFFIIMYMHKEYTAPIAQQPILGKTGDNYCSYVLEQLYQPKNESAVVAVMNAYHTQIIYNAGRWEYSFNEYEMVYASDIFERLDKELYLCSQRVYIYIFLCCMVGTHMDIFI